MRRAAFVLVSLAAPLALLPACPKSAPEATSGKDAAPSGHADASASADLDASASLLVDGIMNAAGTPAQDLKHLMNPDNLPAYSGPTGSVEGTITVEGPPAPDAPARDYSRCPDAVKEYGKRFREGAPRPDGTRPLADAIVAVTGYKGFFVPEKNENARVTIEGCGFSKRTVTMTYGQRLEVKNTTNEFWSPELDPAPNPVIMMAPPRGDAVRLYPKRPGYFRLRDHDRKWAVADAWAFLHPLHTSTTLDGHYRIDGLPVGKLKVNAYHPEMDEKSGIATTEIDVQPSVVVKADLVIHYVPKDGGANDDDAAYRPKLR